MTPTFQMESILRLVMSEQVDRAEAIARLNKELSNWGNESLIRLYTQAVEDQNFYLSAERVDAFHILCNLLVSRRLISMREFQARKNMTVLYNVGFSQSGLPLDMETGEDLTEVLKIYSLMKFGSVADIAWFAKKVSERIIQGLVSGQSILTVFEKARSQNQYVALLSPGSRNVRLAQDLVYVQVVKQVNVWLALNGYPTIMLVRAPRFQSSKANYAELSVAERLREMREVLPGDDFFSRGVHLLFSDDVRITGASADWTEINCLNRGGLSFGSIFCMAVDPLLVQDDPGVEQRINHFHVTPKLDSTTAYILNQPGFIPVQRLLRLLLNVSNRESLAGFLGGVYDHALVEVYSGAMSNDYLADDRYAPSLDIWKKELHRRNLVDSNGLLLG